LHRSELLRYVHRPELIRVNHTTEPTKNTRSTLLNALNYTFAKYDFGKDPYVVELLRQQQEGYDTSRQFQKVMLGGKTYCNDQLKLLATKGEATSQELGWSAMEWYLRQCIARFEEMVHVSESQIFDCTNKEKQHLLKILTQLPLVDLTICHSVLPDRLSRKVEQLVEILVTEAKETPHFTGIIFIEQRVWVATLAEILAVHPQTKDLFHVGTFVGTSQSSKRKTNIAAFAEPRNQQATLDDFRAGKINLILATSVLEEGIDVSSCNVVICFERPKNLKSFVQRRGRARQQMSKYFIFIPEVNGGRPPVSWQSLEDEMRAAYMNDQRKVQFAEEREMDDENGERFFSVPETG
jgi:ERCC4-related helicase